MQRNGGSSRLDVDTLSPPSADGGRSAQQRDVHYYTLGILTAIVTNIGCSGPMVVGGVSSGSNGTGKVYLTVHASPPRVQQGEPMQCAARFEFSVDENVESQFTGESSGNTPDKFYWQCERNYLIDGQPLAINFAIDGRKWILIHDDSEYNLHKGNHFRIRIDPHANVEIEQLRIVDKTVDPDDETSYAQSIFNQSPT
jgi:hypothetical protein